MIGNRPRRGGIVAGQHHRFDAQRLEFGDRLRAFRSQRVGHGKDRHRPAGGDQNHGGPARLLECCEPRFQACGADPQLFRQPVIAQRPFLSVDDTLDAAPLEHAKTLGRQQGHARLLFAPTLHQGARHRMGAVVVQAGGDPQGLRGRHVAQRNDIGQRGFALGQGAGLVERHHLEFSSAFEKYAAFDENAVSGRSRQTADYRHRGGNHERARAGDDQDDQGLVSPFAPGPAQQQWAKHGHQHGERDHGRRVVVREAVHEALRRRPLGLGVLNGGGNSRQGAVPCLRGDDGFHHAVGHYASRIERIAHLLVHRQAFSGNGGLVERGMAGIDAGVERHPGARAHADAGADRNGGQGARLPAIGGLHFGGFRGEGGERADRIARPLQGQRFDGLGQSEQKDHHRRFRPLADDDCADDRQGHQEVDVERPVLEGDPAFLQGGQPGAEYGQRREGHDPLGRLLPGGPGHHLGADRGGAADGQQYLHPSTQGGWQCRRRSARFQQAGRHVQLVQRRGDRLRVVEAVVHRQLPGHQVEVEAHNLRHRLQTVANQAFLGRAIHLVDAVAHRTGALERNARRFPLGGRLAIVIAMTRARRATGIGRPGRLRLRGRAAATTGVLFLVSVRQGGIGGRAWRHGDLFRAAMPRLNSLE